MKVLDTNVLVRFITKDDPQQSPIAREILASHDCLILDTVVLETIWVLESIYGFDAPDVAHALRTVFGLDTVHLRDEERMRRVLDGYEDGLDFADALHLAHAEGQGSFVTFDAGIERRIQQMDDISPERQRLVAHLDTVRM